MATINILRQHTLGKDDAKKRAEELASSLQDKLGIRWRWQGDVIDFDAPSGTAKGVSGKVTVDASSVRVEIDLPFLLRAMKGMVESKVIEKLDAVLPRA